MSKDTRLERRRKESSTDHLLTRLLSSLLNRIKVIFSKVKFISAGMLGGLTKLASRLSRRMKRGTTIAALVTATVLAAHTVSAQLVVPGVGPIASIPPPLNGVGPEPSNLAEFVADKNAAIGLGKALFWDMQVGSDGVQSCASCHFHAGADNRAKNQISPGLLRVNADGTPNQDTAFTKGPNATLQPGDYPFHKLSDPNNAGSTVLADTNDVTGSQGVSNANFVDVVPNSAVDKVTIVPDPVFNVNGTNVRRVEPRNTPTVINAVFNFRNFWDGSAQNDFNGVNPFGSRDPDAKLFKATSLRTLEEVKISLNNSALASQAMAPPLSSFEESGAGRTFQEIGDKFGINSRKVHSAGKRRKLPRKLGKKLTALRPLGKQLVAPDDSVLGPFTNAPAPGLKIPTYQQIIERAFKPEWWRANKIISVAADGSRSVVSRPDRDLTTQEYTLTEYNFPLFFGLAVQLYEATLISNDTPFDRFAAGNASALTAQQQQGLNIFLGQDDTQGGGRCINCHAGAEFTNASVSAVSANRIRRRGGNLIDTGFNNIGVRPTTDDRGLGNSDPFGNSFSEAQLAVEGKFNDPSGSIGRLVPPFDPATEKLGVDGAFKVPALRNVELTAPYFHNGGQLTLRQLVDFYARGGDFLPVKNLKGEEIAPLSKLNLTEEGKEALVAFMKGLTDERVRFDRAPFDHPQLFITNGHPGNETAVTNDGKGQATDELIEMPAVGKNGLSHPRPNFLNS